jgi:hypothetical protein
MVNDQLTRIDYGEKRKGFWGLFFDEWNYPRSPDVAIKCKLQAEIDNPAEL